MAVDSLVGQDLIDEANARLAGYQNGVDPQALLSYLNEGKDEIWALLKNLNQEYFVTPTQNTDNTQLNFFDVLSTAVRQYTLPGDLRSIKFIEIATEGFTDTVFEYKDLTDVEFRDARRDATRRNTPAGQTETIFYTRIGKDQMVLAQFPPANLLITIWYVRSLPDFEPDQAVDEILFPYSKKIADYACKKAMLGLQDSQQFAAWSAEWKQDCITVQSGASPTNSADADFVQDFQG